ncbi:hypothetical protein VNO77_21942 [Canavalia gladiata]|uniref:Uncharacterized protein n=1 Tax=Canavalia gladiata TaxID=3824 RepID=A0AAN9L557_CANGL
MLIRRRRERLDGSDFICGTRERWVEGMMRMDEVGEWDWGLKGGVWVWCSDRDSHVEGCLSCREQVELGHTLDMGYLACLTLLLPSFSLSL